MQSERNKGTCLKFQLILLTIRLKIKIMKIKILAIASLALAITFTACQKEEIQNPEMTTTSEDVAVFQNLMQDTEEEIDYQLETRGGDPENDCPTVTISPDDGSYPRTVTIDYGTEGCEGPNGHIRKGLIEIYLTDAMENPNAERTVTFIGFSIDDVQIAGNKTVINTGVNSEDQPTFSRAVNLAFFFPNGQEANWSSVQTVTLIEGANTTALFDNVWQIEGDSDGVNRNGIPFNSIITTPLIKPRNCPWAVSGVRTITVNDVERTLNYGNGECDRKADLTRPDGSIITILIRRWW